MMPFGSIALVFGVVLVIGALSAPAIVAFPFIGLLPLVGPVFTWLGAWAWLLLPMGIFISAFTLSHSIQIAILVTMLAMVVVFLLGIPIGSPV